MDALPLTVADFGQLPFLALVTIAKYADMKSRMTMLRVCRNWYNCLSASSCWLDVTYDIPGGFKNPTTAMVEIAETFGNLHKRVIVRLETADMSVGFAAMNLVCVLAEVVPRQIQHLTIKCSHAPRGLCRHGENLSVSLKTFFERPVTSRLTGLMSVDLSGLTIAFSDPVFRCLYSNHGQWLTHLNLQSRAVACRISPLSMRYALPNLPALQDLRIFMASFDDDCMKLVVDIHRNTLRHISMLCRYSDAYRHMFLSDSGWELMATNMPNTYATFIINRGYPMDHIEHILLRHIPLKTLIVDPGIDLNMIGLISQNYPNLEKLVLTSKPIADLDEELTQLVVFSKQLRFFYVKHQMSDICCQVIRERIPQVTHNLTNQETNPIGDEEMTRPILPPPNVVN